MLCHLKYLKCTLALSEVDKELDCINLRWSNTKKEDHSSVGLQEGNNKKSPNVSTWLTPEPFRAIHNVGDIERGKCRVPPRS